MLLHESCHTVGRREGGGGGSGVARTGAGGGAAVVVATVVGAGPGYLRTTAHKEMNGSVRLTKRGDHASDILSLSHAYVLVFGWWRRGIVLGSGLRSGGGRR
jgi:hypothetical protein